MTDLICAPSKADYLARGIDELDLDRWRILVQEGVKIRLPDHYELLIWTPGKINRWRARLNEAWHRSGGPMPEWLKEADPHSLTPAGFRVHNRLHLETSHVIENWPQRSKILKRQKVKVGV